MTAEMKFMAAVAEHVDTTSLAYIEVLNAAVQYAREVTARSFRSVADTYHWTAAADLRDLARKMESS